MQRPSVLVDTSVLIQFARGDRKIVTAMRPLIPSHSLAICGMIRQEFLQGARDEPAFRKLQVIAEFFVRLDEIPEDFDAAAGLYRRLRSKGVTPSSQDCLIAAVALRCGVKLWTLDRLFKKMPAISLYEP